ncbi:uncharacterized protein [Chironomus tepperi]|uniref:uncharacterized protein n=1 Tax=Chironomus tepperi TaxID=113505 RepID=UPI00391FB1BB
MSLKVIIILLIFTITSSESSRILCIHTSFAKSHVMPMQHLAKELAARGHEITFISPFPLSKPVKNYRDFEMKLNSDDEKLSEEMRKSFTTGANVFKFLIQLMNTLHRVSNETLQSPWMRELMETESFDLVITGYSMSEYLLGLADHFKCPSVVFWSGHVISSLTKMVGNPLSPESVANAMLSKKKMNFMDRVKNMLMNALDLFVIRNYFNYRSKIIYESHVIPSEILAKLLAQKGHEVTFVSPYPQSKSIKNFRGITLDASDEEMKILDDLQKGMSESKISFSAMSSAVQMLKQFGNETFHTPEMKNLMKNEKFDLVIVGYVMNEYHLGLADHFKCPSIVFFPAFPLSALEKMVGNPLSPEGAPHILANLRSLEGFKDRLMNFIFNAVDLVLMKNYFDYQSKAVYDKSHVMPLQVLAKELAKRGHNVTFIGQFPFSKPVENYRDIKVELRAEYKVIADELGKGMSDGINIFKMIPMLKKLVYEHGNETIQSASVQRLMREEAFDLVVIGYFVTEHLLGFADHFKCPSIVFSSGSHVAPQTKIVGNPLSPEGSQSPLSQTKDHSFISRIQNFLIYGMELLVTRGYLYYESKAVYELALSIAASECSKILFIHPSLSRSHVIPSQVLAKVLAEKGHDVTFMSPYPLGKAVKNLRDIKLEASEEELKLLDEVQKGMSEGQNLFKALPKAAKMFQDYSSESLQSPALRDLMKNEKFDLVIIGYIMNEFMLGLADHFKCPSILFFPASAVASIHKIVGNPLSPEGASHPIRNSAKMDSFLQRVANFMMHSLDLLVIKNYFESGGKAIYDYNFPPDRYRSYDEMIRNVSLVLVNTHFTSSGPRPLLPNLVEVGGLQVKPNPAPLPEDLKTFLGDAKDGAILFSFGSNAKSIYIPEDKLKVILKVFSKLKQRVIMKWESDVLPGKPDNVLISKWLPQDDILAHPNIKAFISHCGYGGVIEAKSNGVPIVGVPLGADQKGNADKIVEEGWAVRLDMVDITEESLTNALKEILNNPKYRDTVRREAILAKDRPLNAQETAVYWVEYVLRHHGAPHLHYPGADLNFFQANSIDVILFIFAVIYAVFKLLKTSSSVKMYGKISAIILFLGIASSECSRILFIHPCMSKSTVLPLQVLAKQMAKNGHDVTFVSVYPLDKKYENYRDIKIEPSEEVLSYYQEMGKKVVDKPSPLQMLKAFDKVAFQLSNETLQSKEVRGLMKEEFDLVVVGYFLNDFLLGLADHFKCPSIVFFSGSHVSPINLMVGNPLSPEGAPHIFSQSNELSTFGHRVVNFLMNIIDRFIIRNLAYYKSKQIYEFNFPSDKYRPYDEVIRSVSLVLVNTHFTSSGPRPLLPNLVEVGGLQIQSNPNPLPEDIKTFLDDAKDGAVLFSFGSNAKSIYIPEDKQKIILKVFSKLKQRVIMKWESDVLPGKPDNVLISKWLPQNDILAHPNIKAFISHCGYGGVIEGKSNGVPIVGIPFVGDQNGNADKIVEEGWALKVQLADVTEETLMNALQEILKNPKYRDTVRKQAFLSKDRPMNAQDTAVYWVEYVLRHKGAPHLHYPGADLNFFQANSIDVILFIFAVIYAAFKFLKFICGLIFCRSKRGSTDKLKTN